MSILFLIEFIELPLSYENKWFQWGFIMYKSDFSWLRNKLEDEYYFDFKID